jgi:hypothetical protein
LHPRKAISVADPLSPPQAARRAGVTRPTVVAWCRRYAGLGRRVAGRWRVDPAVLDRLLAGEELPRQEQEGTARG